MTIPSFFDASVLADDDLTSVRSLIDDATRADGIDPLSEQFLLGLSDSRLDHRHVLARLDGRIVAVGAASDSDAELVVSPDCRNKGIGRELIKRLDVANYWAHGNLPAAHALAEEEHLRQTRRLLVMALDEARLDKAAGEPIDKDRWAVLGLAEASERWGREAVEKAWLEVNNDAFSWHPEQGGWDLDHLRRAQEAEWFRDADVLFLYPFDAEVDDMAGFHWVKFPVDSPDEAEVYVVGLASRFRGQSLGGPLMTAGLVHMKEKGVKRVILYVEDDNVNAVTRYEEIGFTIAEEHCVYSR